MALPPFESLVDDHGEAVYRFCVGAVGPVDGGDCYQDTLLAALRGYPDLRHGRELRAWLFTIAYRKIVDHQRAQARRPTPVDPVPDGAGPPGMDPAVLDTALWDAVRTLPRKQRDAVLHRFVTDLDYDEIGRALGCSPAAARQNVHAGVKRLREVKR